MLEKYRENYDKLSGDALAAVISRTSVNPPAGMSIFDALHERGFEQADVLLALAPDPTVQGIVAIETVLGKPIVREVPKSKETKSRGGAVRKAKSKITDNRIITRVGPNTKKQGSKSWERYNLYREGMRVDEFLKAGGTMADVKWDFERGSIDLNGEGKS